MIQGPEVKDEDPIIEDDDAQLELQLALERYLHFAEVLLLYMQSKIVVPLHAKICFKFQIHAMA